MQALGMEMLVGSSTTSVQKETPQQQKVSSTNLSSSVQLYRVLLSLKKVGNK